MKSSRHGRVPLSRPSMLSTVISAISLAIFLFAMAEQIDAIFHSDRYERVMPERIELPWDSELYLQYGFMLRVHRHSRLYGEQWSAIQPSVSTGDDKFGFNFRIDRYVNHPHWLLHGDSTVVEWGPLASVDIQFPFWSIILTSIWAPVLWLRQIIRYRRAVWRHGRGLCEQCGYDLRGTPDRCPECGLSKRLE